jgi:poly-gamma-glutamate capsule biosynthesis protein CapA/YwtB (metallophosphatase superfamily)
VDQAAEKREEVTCMELLIGGDLVPTLSNMDLFRKGDVAGLLGTELLSQWNQADLRMFNLEVPLTDKETPILKNGPNLIAPENSIIGIKALKPSLVTLANNHILDQGYQGLKSTQELLEKNRIPYIGIGNQIDEASEPYIFKKAGLKIGVYACADHEFSIATETSPGANPFDPLESLDHIQGLKLACDYVIVIYHGGKEHYRYPSPKLQKLCRKMVQKGADLVVCQHSHCIGCYERYKNSTIVYGQGNFIFDDSDSIYWKTSLFIKMVINEEGHRIEYIPIVKAGNRIHLATGIEAVKILTAFDQRSQKLKQQGFLQMRYSEYAKKHYHSYMLSLSGAGKWLSRMDRYLFKGLLIEKLYQPSKLLEIQNFMECEAHRELIMEGIRKKEK